MAENYFEKLANINVNEHTEDKNKLTYLSWAWAINEFMKVYPNMTYKVWRAESGLPYVYDEKTGYMVFTEVTVGELTHEMWLPVMDSANNAMKAEPYEFTTKYGKKVYVASATMFDINKTIMRCLTKNLAMFGLGLYIYAGEDLPEDEAEQIKETPKKVLSRDEMIAQLRDLLAVKGIAETELEKEAGCKIDDLNKAGLEDAMKWVKGA